MGIAFWAFFETGITLILFIGLIIHIVLFQLLLYLFRKNVSSMKKERVEMRKMLSILNQELQSRKNKKRI
jgi:beta-lactamase regulating signal transducer with metallopeptidase domain